MCIIDRYIFKRVIWGYFFLLFTFLALYIVIDISSNLEDILRDKTSFLTVFKYYLFFLPQIFIRISPLSFLVSVLYNIGDLNKNNEILALRSHGFNIFKISKVVLVVAFVLSLVSLYVEDRLIPQTFNVLRNIEGYKEKITKKNKPIDNFAFYTDEGSIVFAGKFIPGNKELENVNIFKYNNSGQIDEEIMTPRMFYKDDKWHAENASVYSVKDNQLSLDNVGFFPEKEMEFTQTPKQILKSVSLEWKNLSLKGIKQQIRKFSIWNTKKIIRVLKSEFHQKIALSFSIFFLVLGTLPFALRIHQRRVGLTSIGLAVLAGFLYYLMFSLCLALGKVGLFFPSLAAWIPNIFFGTSGIFSLSSLN